MLEFTQVFSKGQFVGYVDAKTIMKCKNIDFGHVDWMGDVMFYSSTKCMVHIIDNIIDVNVYDNNDSSTFTFFC